MRSGRPLARLSLLAAFVVVGCGEREGGPGERGAVAGESAAAPAPAAAAPADTFPLPAATPEAPLEDTEWRLVALPGAPDPPAGANATLVLERDGGLLRGSTGCGVFDGSWQLAGSRLSLGVGEARRERCGPELVRLETDYLEALRRAGSYRLRGDTLELLGAEGVVARFDAR